MKKLFTLVCAVIASIAVSAQDFNVGDNVAAKLGLGDVDGMSFSGQVTDNEDTNRPHDKVVVTLGDYWKVDGDLPNEFLESYDGKRGLYGFYDKKTADMYQVVKFPAGAYTVKVQALYREGTPADNFTNHFNKKYMKYGHLYADCLTSEDAASTVTRSFDHVLVSLATADQHEALYTYGDGSWMNDYKYDRKEQVEVDGVMVDSVVSYFCPQCCVGLGEYFEAGKYWNEMKIVVTEETPIRLGFRKTGSITADWLVFTNLQVIYDGPADDAAKMDLAKEEFEAAISNLEDVMNDVEKAGFEALAGSISDAIGYAEDAVAEAKTVDEVVAEKNKINSLIDEYSTTYQFVKNLADLLDQCKTMAETTEYPGYATFKAAYDDAVAKANEDDPEKLLPTAAEYYKNIYNDLSKARADYLISQPKNEDGAWDFTVLVKNPWFVDPQYNPTLNDDGTWTLKEDTWNWGSVGNPGSYNDKKSGRTDISANVTLYPSDDVTNAWYKANRYTSGWSAGVGLMYQSGLIGVSDGWNSLSVGTIGIEQHLVGLPNGYYNLKALGRGQNGDKAWDGKNREIYAENTQGEVVVSETLKNDSDRGLSNGWWEWNPNAWAEVKTAIIEARDGDLKIGGRCSKVANWTGFRLYFYGEELDFSAFLQEDIDLLKPSIEELSFAGDRKIANDILNTIVFPVTGKEAYATELAKFNEAREYVNIALTAQKGYTADATLAELMDYEFTAPAYAYMVSYGDSEEDTYKRVDELNEIANVYKTYCEVYAKASKLDNAEVAGIIAEQTADMSTRMLTADEVGAYLDALSNPYNVALMASLGCADATLEAGANITSFIVNPEFTDDPTTGWSGETPTNNEYAYENGVKVNAELWNKSAFTLSQTIKGLPAGKYELRVKAIYRDGGAVNETLVSEYNASVAAGETPARQNANLIANVTTKGETTSASSPIKMIEALQYTENSFTEVATAWDSEEMGDGSLVYLPTKAVALAGTEKTMSTDIYGDDATEGNYPFDTKVGDYYYPSSMQGFVQVCKKHAADVTNTVQFELTDYSDIEIGIQKTAAIGSDWVIFDSFELYYLSGETFQQVVKERTTGPVSALLAAEKLQIFNKEKGEAIYGPNAQNIAVSNYSDATASTNAVVAYKLEERIEGEKTYYQFKCVTPAGGDYSLWGANPCYLNSQPDASGCTFNLGKDQDVALGSAWELEYKASDDTWAIKNAASGAYLNGAALSEVPVYWTLGTLTEEMVGITSINAAANNAAIYNMAGQRVSNSYKGIVIMNGKKYIVK